jgi:hypothetical protein
MKTAELTGAALDWAVAYALVYEAQANNQTIDLGVVENYSTDWAQGGPIIEREGISVDFDGRSWCASDNAKPRANFGDTLLIAAMRCYVASKLGDTVEIPKVLQ